VPQRKHTGYRGFIGHKEAVGFQLSAVVTKTYQSCRAKRGIWVLACGGNDAGAGEDPDPWLRSAGRIGMAVGGNEG